MAEQSGSKAELDKEGIPLGPAKAELDKDGIPLKAETAQATAQPAPEAGAPSKIPALPAGLKQKKWLLIGLGAAALLVLVVIIGLLVFRGAEPTEEIAAPAQPAAAPAAVKAPDQLILEPFILAYEPIDAQQKGVLIAKLSLTIDPAGELNHQSQLYQIRSVILNSLAKNAALYGQEDLRDILARELKQFGIKNVSFTSFEQR